MDRVRRINVTEPAFFTELQAQFKSRSLDDWKTYLRWHLAHAKAPFLSSAFVTANFDFYNKYLRGVQAMQPLWKRCVQRVDRRPGRSARPGVRAKDLRRRTPKPARWQ